jgi:hypothetical protein
MRTTRGRPFQLCGLPHSARVALHTRVQVVRKAHARLYAVDCSSEELAELESIQEWTIVEAGKIVRRALSTLAPVRRLRVVCLGRAARPAGMPVEVRRFLDHGAWGTWYPRSNTGMVRFISDERIDRPLLHELAHGVLDSLTGGFPYPYAVGEGLSRFVDASLTGKLGHNPHLWKTGSVPRQCCWADSECMPIVELLSYRPAYPQPDDLTFQARVSIFSLWLYAYLLRLASFRPAVRRMFVDLWKKRIYTPDGVYSWLQEASGVDAGALEESFRQFCTLGVAPNRWRLGRSGGEA